MLKTYGRNKPYLFWFGKSQRCKMGHFAISIYLSISISHKTARVVRQTPSWSHRGADIVDCIILYNSCSFSACRWTTIPSHLVIGLLDWLQWWTKVAISSEKRKNFEIFLCPRWTFFFKKNIQKYFKIGFLYVLDDSEMIWEKNIFSIFRTKSSALAHSGGRTVHSISISL